MLTNLDKLIQRLQDSEYTYLLLEPLPLFGLFFGLIFLCVGIYLKQDKTRTVSLILIALSCVSVALYERQRGKAMPRILQVRTELRRNITEQTKLRSESKWVYYSIAGAALVVLIGGGKLGSIGNYGMLIIGGVGLIFSLWLHMREAIVYHPNIPKLQLKSRT